MNGISYRHWLGLIQNNPLEKIRPATVIHAYKERKDHLEEIGVSSTRLWAFGYKMKQRKALCWNDSTMPIITVNPAIEQDYEFTIRQLIISADMIITKLRRCVKDALFAPVKNKKSKVSGDFSIIESRFWQDTESEFYRVLEDSKMALEKKQNLDDIKIGWLKLLKKQSIALFDQYSQSEQIVTVTNPRRIIDARKDLLIFLNSSKKLYDALNLSKSTLKIKDSDLGEKNIKKT